MSEITAHQAERMCIHLRTMQDLVMMLHDTVRTIAVNKGAIDPQNIAQEALEEFEKIVKKHGALSL